MGFAVFILPLASDKKKAAYALLHRPMGITAFLLGVGAILMGLQEKSGFLYGADKYVPVIMLPSWLAVAVAITATCSLVPWASGGYGAFADQAMDAAADVLN